MWRKAPKMGVGGKRKALRAITFYCNLDATPPGKSVMRNQRTLKSVQTVAGFGYWSGKDVEIEFHPAPANHGVVFVRTDLSGHKRIPAVVENRIDIPRRTVLSAGGAAVEMVEHVLAALAGMQVDNCDVRVNAAELPGCDGSSLPFVEAIERAGTEEQSAPKATLRIREVTRVGDDETWVEISPHRGKQKSGLSIRYKLDYGPNTPIGKQTIELNVTPANFKKELASARTFLLDTEAEWLRGQGLGSRCNNSDLLIFGPEGVIENTLRFEDECVRHKALDLVGDLALAGYDLQGSVFAFRSGHRLNAELVRHALVEGELVCGTRRVA
jgi:UDP-3-O-[3-hydroxymyristoyl] N-acetylglucosamine deacetylase